MAAILILMKLSKNNKTISVDLGFIVFNELTYPNLLNFFEELDVAYEKSDMSFAVSVQNTKVEYGGKRSQSIICKQAKYF